MHHTRRLCACLPLFAAFFALITGCSTAVRTASSFSGDFTIEAVAADHHIASAAGARMLALGGNAVDAAVATSFALSVVRPYSCGIGGGGFMVIHLPADPVRGRVTTALNYRETCPQGIDSDFFQGRPLDSSRIGGPAVAVPGTVAGLLHALEHYGTLDRAQVLQPAILAAERGFIVDAHYLAEAQSLVAKFRQNPQLQERFPLLWNQYLLQGHVQEGSRITSPQQAQVLRLIARSGRDGFYAGPVAEAIVASVAGDGGVLTLEDLASYRVREVPPLEFAFDDGIILTMPPPSSGGVALAQMLGLLHRTGGLSQTHDVSASDHRLIEAMKHAFADRARYMADPDFVPVPIERLLSDEHLDALAARFDPSGVQSPSTYGSTAEPASLLPDDAGTSHFCVVDQWGGAVSCTETINLAFGSKLGVTEFGFLLNNEMDDFTTKVGQANAFGLVQSETNLPEPGKRPLSSMTPTIVLDANGSVRVIAGASGGPRIISATTQVILHALQGKPAGEAVASPRLHHQWSPNVVRFEAAAAHRAAALQQLGHATSLSEALANTQAISRTANGWQAASDPRKGGRPAGR